MALLRIKQWIGQRPSLVAGGIFVLALILYAIAYLIERGFTGLSTGAVIAAVATALLLAAVSVTIEQYIKAKLSDQEVSTALKCREFGIQNLEERSVSRGIGLSPPHELLNICRSEVLVIGYSADKFVEDYQSWIVEALDKGKYVGILILHPEQLEQANYTERQRDIKPQIKKTLGYCKKFVDESPEREKRLWVRGYRGHFYFTGIFVDRSIVTTTPSPSTNGPVRIQLKANFKSQHEGLLLTFNSQSRHATYYEESCREIWNRAEDLNTKENVMSLTE
jgi:hypothetical protein